MSSYTIPCLDCSLIFNASFWLSAQSGHWQALCSWLWVIRQQIKWEQLLKPIYEEKENNYPCTYCVCVKAGHADICLLFYMCMCVYIYLRAGESDLCCVVSFSDGWRTKADTELGGGVGLHGELDHTHIQTKTENSSHGDSEKWQTIWKYTSTQPRVL